MISASSQVAHRRHLTTAVIVLIVASAVGIRLYRLGVPDMWVDEFGQAVAASRPLRQLLQLVQKHHGATPVDYLVTSLMVRISREAGFLRLTAVLWGALSVYWIYRVTAYTASRKAAVVAALLLAVSPLHIRYSQELRFYSLFVLLCLVSTEALWQAWRRHTWRAWLIYGLLMLLTLYSHYYGLLILAFHAVWVLAKQLEASSLAQESTPRSGRVVAFIGLAFAVTVAFVPWMVYDAFHEQGLTNIELPIFSTELIIDVITQFSGQERSWWWLWTLFAVVGLIVQIRNSRPTGILWAVWVMASLPIIVILDLFGNYFFHIRQMLFVLPVFLILAATGVSSIVDAVSSALVRAGALRQPQIFQRAILTALTMTIVAATLPQVADYFQEDAQGRHEHWRAAILFIEQNHDRDSVVLAPRTEEYVEYLSQLTAERTKWVRTLAELKTLYEQGSPLWFLETPYIGHVDDHAEMQQWLWSEPHLTFDFGDRFQVYYLQAGKDVPDLWTTARHFTFPNTARMWADQGVALKQDDPQAALLAYEQAIALAGSVAEERVEYLNAAADISSRLGDFAKALRYYDQVLTIRPDYADALIKKGYMLLQLDDPAAAEVVLTTAVAQPGNDSYWLRRWLGVALIRLDRPEQALPHLLKALEYDSQAHDIRFMLGLAYKELEQNDEAAFWWRSYLDHQPSGPFASAARDGLDSISD